MSSTEPLGNGPVEALDRPDPNGSPPAPLTVVAAGVSAHTGGRMLFEGLNATLTPGQFVAVLGPNGAGKSTFLRMLLGLHPVAVGSLRVLGDRPGPRSQNIGYLPQRRSFDAAVRIRGVDLVRLGHDRRLFRLRAGPGGRARLNDVVTGVVFTWLLGLGLLFLSIFTSSRATGYGTGAIRVLFGSIFAISGATAVQTGCIALGVVVTMLVIDRPLLFASVDPGVAEARGVPVPALNVVFLVAVGVMVAQLVQVVGALLLLGLITTPAATASRLTARPWRAVAASVAIAVATVWLGLWLGYVQPTIPPSSAIVGTGFLAWLAVEVADRLRRRHRSHRPVADRRAAIHPEPPQAG